MEKDDNTLNVGDIVRLRGRLRTAKIEKIHEPASEGWCQLTEALNGTRQWHMHDLERVNRHWQGRNKRRGAKRRRRAAQ